MYNKEEIDIVRINKVLEKIRQEKCTLKAIAPAKKVADLSKSRFFTENIKLILDILEKFKKEFSEKYTNLKSENKKVVRGNLYRYVNMLIYDYYENFNNIHHTGGKPYCNSSGETVGLNEDDHKDFHACIDNIFNDIKSEKTNSYSVNITSLKKLVDDIDQYINTIIDEGELDDGQELEENISLAETSEKNENYSENSNNNIRCTDDSDIVVGCPGEYISTLFDEDELDDGRELEENKASNEENISLAETNEKNENYSENSNNNIRCTNNSENEKCDLSLNNKNKSNDQISEEIKQKIIELNEKNRKIKSSTSDFCKSIIEFTKKKNNSKKEIVEKRTNIINMFEETEKLKTSINSNDFDSDIYYNYIDQERFKDNIESITKNNIKIDFVKDKIKNLKANIKNLAKSEEILKKTGLIRQIVILEKELNTNDRQLLENRYKKIENLNNHINQKIEILESMKNTPAYYDEKLIFLKKYLEKRRDEINITNIELLREISKINKNLNYLDSNQIPKDYISERNKTFLDDAIFKEYKEYEKKLLTEFKNVFLEETDKIDLLLNKSIEDIIIKRLERKREEIIKSYDNYNEKLLNDISDIDMIINCLKVGFYKDENYRSMIIAILKDLGIENLENFVRKKNIENTIKLLEQLKEEIEFCYTKEDETEKISRIDESLNYLKTGFYKDEDDRLSIEEFLKELKEQEMKKYANELRSIYELIKKENEKYYKESEERIKFLGEFSKELEGASEVLAELKDIFPDQQQQLP